LQIAQVNKSRSANTPDTQEKNAFTSEHCSLLIAPLDTSYRLREEGHVFVIASLSHCLSVGNVLKNYRWIFAKVWGVV